MTEEDKRNKIAKALQALLQLDGATISLKEVMEKIKDRDVNVNDLIILKNELLTNLPDPAPTITDRKQVLKDFIIQNWDLIKDNEVVKDTLIGAYCRGRYNKDQREDMIKDLLAEVNRSSQPDTNTPDHREFNF